jgi:hypothetical protein
MASQRIPGIGLRHRNHRYKERDKRKDEDIYMNKGGEMGVTTTEPVFDIYIDAKEPETTHTQSKNKTILWLNIKEEF